MDPYAMGRTGGQFNMTAGSGFSSGGAKGSSLKGKLQELEENIRAISDDINQHKKEVDMLRAEKGTLEHILTMKTTEVRNTMTKEVDRVEEEMKRNFGQQKTENTRLQSQIISLKTEKTGLQQQLLSLQRRIAELELQVGSEDI